MVFMKKRKRIKAKKTDVCVGVSELYISYSKGNVRLMNNLNKHYAVSLIRSVLLFFIRI